MQETVTPLAGVWIEIEQLQPVFRTGLVTPLAGVWIEIVVAPGRTGFFSSLPLRECGLKYYMCRKVKSGICVTPLAGVWIEIFFLRFTVFSPPSLPLRECGLKLN